MTLIGGLSYISTSAKFMLRVNLEGRSCPAIESISTLEFTVDSLLTLCCVLPHSRHLIRCFTAALLLTFNVLCYVMMSPILERHDLGWLALYRG